MNDELLVQLYTLMQQIGTGKIEPSIQVRNGQITQVKMTGSKTHLYNRTENDSNNNLTAVQHIGERIKTALEKDDTKHITFTIDFHKQKIQKVSWQSEVTINRVIDS